jgi:hypothetical protein
MAELSTYQGSAPGMRSNLDIFSLPPTDTSVVASNYISFTPTSDIKQELGSVQFIVPPTATQYIDLNTTLLYIQAKIVQSDGTDLADTDLVCPTNLFFYSMWKNCTVSINGTIVNDVQSYPYAAALPALLTNGQGQKETELTSMLFYKDTLPDTFDIATNVGFKKRIELSKNSKVFDMVGPISTGICQQIRYLPTNCSLRIEFIRSAPELCLDAATTAKTYKIVLEQAMLHVKMHGISPTVLTKHNQLFSKGRAQFPYRSTVVRSNRIARGSTSFISEAIFVGRVPQTIVLGLVEASAWDGTLNKNFLNFQPFNLASMTVSCDNETLLYRSLEFNFGSKLYMMGYQTIFNAIGVNNPNGNFINRDEYANGNTLFLINLLPATIGSEFNPMKSGQLKVSTSSSSSIIITFAKFKVVNFLIFLG